MGFDPLSLPGGMGMLQVVETSDTTEQAWKTDRGSLRIRRPLPEVIVFIEEGHLDNAFASLIKEASNNALKCPKPLHLFVDAYDLVSYTPDVRKGPTDWLMANRSRVALQHMLVRSKITKMGLSVASLALGGLLKGHASRASFRLALDETLSQLRNPGRGARF